MKRGIFLSMAFLLVLLLAQAAWGQNLQDYFEEGARKNKISDYRGALEAWEKGLALANRTDNKQAIAFFLGNIGWVYKTLGDYPKALSCFEQSLKISRELGNRMFEGGNLLIIGGLYINLGDYPKALRHYEQSLKISRELGDKKLERGTLENIGSAHIKLSDYSKALTYYEQSLKISKELGDRNLEGGTLGIIGGLYINLGDYPKALTCSEQSLMISRELGDRKGEGESLNNIGGIYMNLGEYDKALSYFEQSLKVTKDIKVISIVYVEANMCNTYLEQGRFKEASEVFQRLNEYYKANPDIRFNITFGRYYLRTGDYRKAKEKFADTIEREEAREMFAAHFLFSGYVGLGLSYEGLRDYPKAMECFQKGIDLTEKQRGALGEAERERYLEAKVGFFLRLEPYNGMIRVLIKEKGKDYPKNSFFFAERGKSRVFLEMLATRGLKGKGKTEEDKTILEKEKEYQQELRVLRKRMEVLENLGTKAPQEDFLQLKKELENKETEFERFIKEVKLKNSELASLISVSPTPVEKIQSLLDQNTTLLEYYNTEDTLYAWLLTKDNINLNSNNILYTSRVS